MFGWMPLVYGYSPGYSSWIEEFSEPFISVWSYIEAISILLSVWKLGFLSENLSVSGYSKVFYSIF
jgi:hypothetical protein